MTKGANLALKRFHRAAETVPAYQKFLKRHRVNPKKVRTMKDFALLPETSKKDYIEKYSLAERSPGGVLSSNRFFAASSGTTGMPTLWPRGEEQEAEGAAIVEFLLTELYGIDHRKTLLVSGFPLGVHSSGIAMATWGLAASFRHPNLSVVTPGNNKEAALALMQQLADSYQQVIVAGHPFFAKDVLEAYHQANPKHRAHLRAFLAAEGFQEEWRSYVASKVDISPERDILSHYASTEFMLTGHESPESVTIRRTAAANERLCQKLFQSPTPPDLFHYDPTLRYIETNENQELLFTAWSGIPLIRYNLHDTGTILSRTEMEEAFESEQMSLKQTLKKARVQPWNLPYVALGGRSDYMLNFYAANIYPKHIHAALEREPFLGETTGKFSMEKILVKGSEETLLIHIELAENVKDTPELAAALGEAITETLLTLNIEYRDASHHLGKDMRPRILLHPFRDPVYFPPGMKPKYIKK